MSTILNPYINFNGNAREAMLYYQDVLGGTLDINTFAEGGMPHDPADAEKTMHAMLKTDSGIVLMASDSPDAQSFTEGSQISISLSGTDEAELRGYYDKLADGGVITLPLEKSPWGDIFGMCTDRFGITWLVNITQ